jgi:hypothetical protein
MQSHAGELQETVMKIPSQTVLGVGRASDFDYSAGPNPV